MTKQLIALVLIFSLCTYTNAQENLKYNLGNGLLFFKYETKNLFAQKHIQLYKDSLLKSPLIELTFENTNCPTCMPCLQSDRYTGTIHPFFCSTYEGGMAFVYTQKTATSVQIFTDRLGTIAYLPLKTGTIYTWDEYMQWQIKKGEYYTFYRAGGGDSTVLYDKMYGVKKLPKPNKQNFVNVNFKNIDNLDFYPIKVEGYWVKLKAMQAKKTVGYCWIIWRNDFEFLKGFQIQY